MRLRFGATRPGAPISSRRGHSAADSVRHRLRPRRRGGRQRLRRSGRRSLPTGSCRSPSSPTPARATSASATPPRAPASRSSSRVGRRCSPSSVRASSEEVAAWRSRSASSARTGTSPSAASAPGPGRVNYLLGNDPAKWRTGLRPTSVSSATSGRVRTWSSRARTGIEVRVLVRPGARVRVVLGDRGAKRPRSTGKETCVSTPRSASSRTRPLAQLVARRVPVRSSFALDRAVRAMASPSAGLRRRTCQSAPGLLHRPGRGLRSLGSSIAVDGAGSADRPSTRITTDLPRRGCGFDPAPTGKGPRDAVAPPSPVLSR